jgi:hypothetical protein
MQREFRIFTFSNSTGVIKLVVADWTTEEESDKFGTGLRPSPIAEFPVNRRYRKEEQRPLAEALRDALNAQAAATPSLSLKV